MALSGNLLRARGVVGPIDLWVASPATAGATFTDLAAAPTITELSTSARRSLDLRQVLKWQSTGVLGVGAVSGGTVGFQYSVNGTDWFWLDGTSGSAPAASADPVMSLTGPAVAMISSAAIVVPAAARTANTIMRIVATGGNGTADPTIRSLTLVAAELVL